MDALRGGKRPENLDPMHPARHLKSFWDDLSIFDDVLLVYKSNRVLVPSKMRFDILEKLHISHSGISKTKELARQFYFWPGLSKQIETMIGNCEVCRLHRPSLSDATQS